MGGTWRGAGEEVKFAVTERWGGHTTFEPMALLIFLL
jgi:hypothetical protein